MVKTESKAPQAHPALTAPPRLSAQTATGILVRLIPASRRAVSKAYRAKTAGTICRL